jgi:hypothetical protein
MEAAYLQKSLSASKASFNPNSPAKEKSKQPLPCCPT